MILIHLLFMRSLAIYTVCRFLFRVLQLAYRNIYIWFWTVCTDLVVAGCNEQLLYSYFEKGCRKKLWVFTGILHIGQEELYVENLFFLSGDLYL